MSLDNNRISSLTKTYFINSSSKPHIVPTIPLKKKGSQLQRGYNIASSSMPDLSLKSTRLHKRKILQNDDINHLAKGYSKDRES